MGLISFLGGVGEKLFGKEVEAAPAEQKHELKASALLGHVKSLGLTYQSLTIKVQNDTVTLAGEVAQQADAEKIAVAVGNVEGVKVVDNQIKVAVPEPPAQYHTVEKGDWLSKIAQKYYGDPQKFPLIFEANKPMLTDPDKIYPGQVLLIPPMK